MLGDENVSKGTILWSSDSPLVATGYSTASLRILNGLTAKGWNCHQLCHNLPTQSCLPQADVLPGWTLSQGTRINYNLHGTSSRAPYCQDLIIPLIRQLNANYFITLLDTFMVMPWYMHMDFGPARSCFYYPSDGGGGLPQGCENILYKMNFNVGMAKFAQKQVKDIHGLPTDYIPLGVDHQNFFKLDKEAKLRAKQRFGVQGKFVVGTVARNQGRKFLDKTLKAFYHFAKIAPDAVLLLHTDPNDIAAGVSLPLLIARLGLQNRVVFTGMRYFNGFSYEQMNEVYNAMDVFILTTSGEGFGIPMVEAMSCEVPVLATNYTTTPEIVLDNNAGLGIKLVGTKEITAQEFFAQNMNAYDTSMINGTLTGSWSVERGLPDVEDAAQKLKILYDDIKMREEFGANGRVAVLRDYTWDKIIDDWDKLLERKL